MVIEFHACQFFIQFYLHEPKLKGIPTKQAHYSVLKGTFFHLSFTRRSAQVSTVKSLIEQILLGNQERPNCLNKLTFWWNRPFNASLG